MEKMGKITEGLLQSPVSSFFDPRICTLLEKANVCTMLDLFRCCGRVIECRDCEVEKPCDRKKLMRINNVGLKTRNQIYTRLEKLGVLKPRGAGPENQPLSELKGR